MYNQKRKKIITIIICVLVVIAIVGIGGAILYLKTDLFKPTEMLFFKYAGQTASNLKYVKNSQLSQIEDLKSKKSSELTGNVKFEINNSDGNSQNGQANIEYISNVTNNSAYGKIDLHKDNQNIFNVEYAKSNNIYALKSDEIVSAFIGVENDNLKVVAQKLGIKEIPAISNKIEKIDTNNLFEISDEEKQHIKETYIEIIKQNVDKSKITKDKLTVSKGETSYNATAYRLTLTGDELKKVEIACLEELKQDSITLNLIATKAKELELNEDYTEVNNLTKQIQNVIDEINKSTTNGLKITIYADNMQVITTEIIYNDEYKYTVYGTSTDTNSERYLLVENLNSDDDFSKIEIKETETRAEGESIYNVSLNVDNIRTVEINLDYIGTASGNRVTTTGTIILSDEDYTVTANYSDELTFKDTVSETIELIRNVNCGVLNDYTTEQLQALMFALTLRTTEVVNSKLELFGINTNSNNPIVITDDTENSETAQYNENV